MQFQLWWISPIIIIHGIISIKSCIKYHYDNLIVLLNEGLAQARLLTTVPRCYFITANKSSKISKSC